MAAALPSARVLEFIRHLRLNGFPLGVAEAEAACTVLAAVPPGSGAARLWPVRLALRSLLAGNREEWQRFDALFDAWWLAGPRRGRRLRQRQAAEPAARQGRRPALWNAVLPSEGEAAAGASAVETAPEEDDGNPPEVAERPGRLVASRRSVMSRTDLRRFSTPEEAAAAEAVALRLAAALRYRLSRRRVAARRGRQLDLRRTIRRSLGHGGEPLEPAWRRRPDRPVRLVVLLDVSGSMQVYARWFLLFLRGLVGGWGRTDAYLFHTRLVRVTDALRNRDTNRALSQLSLMAQGFGGGTRIAGALADFNDRHARSAIDSRTVVVVMSDGYDTDAPQDLARELARLKRRARRLVWLNPLKGWQDYAPVARGMAAALPHLDCFAAANTLESLAALEAEFAHV
ncbi:VWA domain-containing protein [Marinibaculum pumilum]|uniref:VWA domain-containing protein n=1 Tax=Marinibaculum pumilum TaxID=1766165 RepID=A0ABV7L441_9PROT